MYVLVEVKVLIQNVFVSVLISQLLLKNSFLKFNMFNMYKNNISKMLLVFFLTLKLLIWYRFFDI